MERMYVHLDVHVCVYLPVYMYVGLVRCFFESGV